MFIRYSMTECAEAAKAGDLQLLKQLREEGKEWNKGTTAYSAIHGHLDCLKYAIENGCDYERGFMCIYAAGNGHLDCLTYLYNHGGFEWNAETCRLASHHGHLECLKYMHENGCEWDIDTVNYAAQSGHTDCIQYAIQNGCEWNESSVHNSLYIGHINTFKYFYQEWSKTKPLQTFWRTRFKYNLSKITDKIDLDDTWWRYSLFDIDLSSQPDLQDMVIAKKKQIEIEKLSCMASLKNTLIHDIIRHCIYSYI